MTVDDVIRGRTPAGGLVAALVAAAEHESVGYEVMLATGISPRQLDVWTRSGILMLAAAARGSGTPRRWRPGEQVVAARMGRLTAAGLTPRVAERVARSRMASLGDRALVVAEIAPGIHVIVGDPEASEEPR